MMTRFPFCSSLRNSLHTLIGSAVLAGMFLVLLCHPVHAGEWSALIGVGGGNADAVTGDLTLRHTFNSFYSGEAFDVRPMIEASGIYWQNSDDSIGGGGISFGLVINFWREGSWNPYVSGSFGGFMLSDNRMGSHNLGCNFQFRTKGSLGISMGQERRHSIQLDAAHYSNAGLGSSNSGFNVFGVSYGFRF